MNSYTQNILKSIGDGILLLLVFVMVSCSQGIRMKNWVNYQIELSTLEALDTLKQSPEIVKFSGSQVATFREIENDIRIQGRHDERPVWTGDKQGCFAVDQGAKVYISDFNFQGKAEGISLIQVISGHLILENCDFRSNEFWAIEVDSAAILELRNVHFSELRGGAIMIRGGQAKIFDSGFEGVGRTAVYASGGDLFEIHNSTLRNTMGSALEINSVNEVWLDSVRVIDSFQDGIVISGCDYVLINQVDSRENGRHGLVLEEAKICGILNFSALGNLVKGVEISSVDTLRIVNSEFVGNGESGGSIYQIQRSRLSGIQVGHNGSEGLQFTQGQELWINKSSFQGNPGTGLVVDSLYSIDLQEVTLVNNGIGLQVEDFDSLGIHHSLLGRNQAKSMDVKRGDHVHISENLVKQNQSGLVIHDVLYVHLDSNRVEANTLGNDIQSIPNLKMNDNQWVSNESGAYFSDIGSMSSTRDEWLSNLDAGLEIFSASELIIADAKIHNNRKGALFNEVSLRLESSVIDSCREIGLKLMNSHGVMEKLEFQHNGVALELAEGSQAKITQSNFLRNETALKAEASVSLTFSFSTVSHSRNGIQLGNYSEAKILSSQFNLIDGYAVQLSGPHVQSLLLRQNVISKAGGILKSRVSSGDIQIRSNTFVNNKSSIAAPKGSLSILDHNIFFHTDLIDPQLLRDKQLYKGNCLYPVAANQKSDSAESSNIYVDPDFGASYYLLPHSPCLQGGENGMLIGALGPVPIARPSLQP